MSKKTELKQIAEAYKTVVLNELNLGPAAETTNTVPANNTATVVALKKEEDNEHMEVEPTETESHMAKSELYKIHKAAKELYNLIGDGENLEPWVFSKITVAASYLEGVKNYVEYNKFKSDGEFNNEHDSHEFKIVTKIRDMLHGESRQVIETVLRDAIFSLEALNTIQETKQ